MSYLIKLIKSLKEFLIAYTLQYVVIIIASIIYLLSGHDNLNQFLTLYCPPILIIFYLTVIIYLFKKYPKKEFHLSKSKSFFLISLGISLSCFLNMIIFLINPPTPTITLPFFLILISSGIIGPVYEELLFRYLILTKLKTFNSTNKSIFIDSIIFALIHLYPLKIFYAFILGLVLNISYQKYKNILAPILIHSSANIIALFLYKYNIYILILSIISLLLNLKINKKIK